MDKSSIGFLFSAGVCGLLLSAAWLFPSLYLVSLIGHSWLVFYALTHRESASLLFGTVAGTIALVIAFHWSPASIAETTNLVWPWTTISFLVLIIWESLIFGLFAMITALAVRRNEHFIWLAPTWWVALEFSWPRVFTWAIAHTHTAVVPVLQLAEFMGTGGVSAVVILAAITIAKTIELGYEKKPVLNVVTSYLFLAAVLVWGTYRVNQIEARMMNASTVRVAAIQVDPTFVDAVDKMRAITLRRQEDVELVLWPESSLGHYHESLTDFRDPIKTSELSEAPNPAEDPTEGFKVELIAGGKTYPDGGRGCGPYCNTAFLIDPAKSIVAKYVKRTLMPVGEYLPGESLLPVARDWVALESKLVQGTNDAPLTISSGHKVGTLICYEDMIAANSRRTVLGGAEFLIAIINGSGFRDVDTLVQHLRLAQLRAIENRRSLLRCAATGITCHVVPTGKIQESLPSGVEAELIASIPLCSELTIYTRFGEWFAWLCVAVSIGMVAALRFWPFGFGPDCVSP